MSLLNDSYAEASVKLSSTYLVKIYLGIFTYRGTKYRIPIIFDQIIPINEIFGIRATKSTFQSPTAHSSKRRNKYLKKCIPG